MPSTTYRFLVRFQARALYSALRALGLIGLLADCFGTMPAEAAVVVIELFVELWRVGHATFMASFAFAK